MTRDFARGVLAGVLRSPQYLGHELVQRALTFLADEAKETERLRAALEEALVYDVVEDGEEFVTCQGCPTLPRFEHRGAIVHEGECPLARRSS